MLEPEQFDVTGEKSEGGLDLTKSQVRRSAKAPQLLHSQDEFIQWLVLVMSSTTP